MHKRLRKRILVPVLTEGNPEMLFLTRSMRLTLSGDGEQGRPKDRAAMHEEDVIQAELIRRKRSQEVADTASAMDGPKRIETVESTKDVKK